MADDVSDVIVPLPDFVHWSIFPFVGELRVRPIEPPRDVDAPRDGEPGGAPCRSCAATDDVWSRNLGVVASELARDGGRAVV
jgi:hypothetical protein